MSLWSFARFGSLVIFLGFAARTLAANDKLHLAQASTLQTYTTWPNRLVGPSRVRRLSSFAALLLCDVVLERSHCIAYAGVSQVVHTFAKQAFCIRERVDFRAGDATQVSVQALHSGRELAVSEYQIGVHALKHMLGSFPYNVVRKIDLFDNARQVRETAAIVRSQDPLIGYAEAFELVHHVVPALQRQQRVVEGKVLRLFRRLLAVAIVFGVEVPDAVGLAERFD